MVEERGRLLIHGHGVDDLQSQWKPLLIAGLLITSPCVGLSGRRAAGRLSRSRWKIIYSLIGDINSNVNCLGAIMSEIFGHIPPELLSSSRPRTLPWHAHCSSLPGGSRHP